MLMLWLLNGKEGENDRGGERRRKSDKYSDAALLMRREE